MLIWRPAPLSADLYPLVIGLPRVAHSDGWLCSLLDIRLGEDTNLRGPVNEVMGSGGHRTISVKDSSRNDIAGQGSHCTVYPRHRRQGNKGTFRYKGPGKHMYLAVLCLPSEPVLVDLLNNGHVLTGLETQLLLALCLKIIQNLDLKWEVGGA